MTRAILFDLGNVLVGFDFQRGYRALAGVSPFRAEEIPERIATTGLVHPYERGEVSSRDFFRRLSDALDLKVSYQQFCDLWTTIFLREPLVSEALVAGLARNCRLVLVSNTNEIHFRMIERTYKLLAHFHARALSYEVGAMKPSPQIYAEAVRLAGCAPHECFYTDDVDEFVQGGLRQGLDAAIFRGQADLEQQLRSRGLAWS